MKTYTDLPCEITELCVACIAVGSRAVCNPPPTDTDQDVLCLVDDSDMDDLCLWLIDHDWSYEGVNYLTSNFESYRKEVNGTEINLIITGDEEWFDKFIDASILCQKENALNKKRRIEIFDSVMGKKSSKIKGLSTSLFITDDLENVSAPQGLGAAGAANQIHGQWISPQLSLTAAASFWNSHPSPTSFWGTVPLYPDTPVEW